jgi:hypothetical protein
MNDTNNRANEIEKVIRDTITLLDRCKDEAQVQMFYGSIHGMLTALEIVRGDRNSPIVQELVRSTNTAHANAVRVLNAKGGAA